jgi:GMP synthase (glutamine-hydrolysing)
VADARVLVVQNSADDPVGRLGEWLQGAGLAVDVVQGSDLPPNLDDVPGLLVLGGDMGAYDDDIAPWLPHLRALLREAVEREVPTLAICLGAQLLAAASGGRVQPDPDGPEIGAQLVAKRTAASRDPLFAAVPITPDVHQWHYDAITVLPRGAILLASSPRGEHQAFRLGRLAWAVQFHIETTPDTILEWARADAGRLADYDLDAIVARVRSVDADFAEVWSAFAAAFADIVRNPDAVPAPRMVPSTTAAPVTDPAAIRAALAAEAAGARAVLPPPGRRAPD